MNQYLINNEVLYSKLKESFKKLTLSNSVIIYGEKGIGKSTFVKNFIEQLFVNFKNIDNNNLSKHTILLKNNTHPNFRLITNQIDEKTKKLRNNIIVNQIRDLILFIYQ